MPIGVASYLVLASDNPERLVSEASFAALGGTSPVEASPSKTQRRRLNRGGDRQANAALYRIVLSWLRWDARSQDYLRRRFAEGNTRREIIRCSSGTEWLEQARRVRAAMSALGEGVAERLPGEPVDCGQCRNLTAGAGWKSDPTWR
ncbi:transposase [Streptomyces sp. NPDC057460]|uniref:transposase n=1 Tax=Streptomyces sp. NPDC057460 TaxID=3346141 RepID=UPI0036B36585